MRTFDNRKVSLSKLGFIFILAQKTNKCAILHYSSKKFNLITRDGMAAKTLPFVDSFDNSVLIKYDTQQMLNRDILVLMLIVLIGWIIY